MDSHNKPSPLTLEAPEPVAPIAAAGVAGVVALKPEQVAALDARARDFVREIAALDPNAPEFGRKSEQLAYLGRKEISDAAGQSSRFLDRPIRAINQENGVSADLAGLRRVIEDLDPSRQGDLLSPRKFLGLIPYGDKLRDYFDSYTSSQAHISAILARLAAGRDELLKDNAAIDVERQKLWEAMGRLQQMVHISKSLDTRLESAAAELSYSEPAKTRAIREQAVFHVRQRTQDLLTQMAVALQGYMALDLVKRNNIELVKGVDRASTTTIAALRTAVMVSSALTSQRLVLDQIGAVNRATASIVDATGDLLRSNSADIHEQAASAAIPLATLQQAFENIYLTMDSIDNFKAKALSSMKSTVETLSSEVEKSQAHIARSEGRSAAPSSADDAGALSAI